VDPVPDPLFSENLVAPGIEPGPLDLYPGIWVDIKMDLGEIGWNSRDWIDLTQDRSKWRTFVKAVIDLRVP
jgi:hypothetical protein